MALRPAHFALAFALAAGLSACSSSDSGGGGVFGVALDSPDEFNVAPRKPLRMPGDFAVLPTPQPGAISPLEERPAETANAALAGAGTVIVGANQETEENVVLSESDGGDAIDENTKVVSLPQSDTGEAKFLAAIGADEADPNIRNELNVAVKTESQYGLTTFLGYKVPDGSENEVLNPRDETARLTEQGLPSPTPAPLPAKDPKDSSTFTLDDLNNF